MHIIISLPVQQGSTAPHSRSLVPVLPAILELPQELVRNSHSWRHLQTQWLKISEHEAQECASYQSAQGILTYTEVLEVFPKKIKTSLNERLYGAVPCHPFCLSLWCVPLRGLCSNKTKICTCQKYWITLSSSDTVALPYLIALAHPVPCS